MPPSITVITDLSKFWGQVSVLAPGECWPWLGRTDRHGYGEYKLTVDGRGVTWRAHRVAYELAVAPIPEGLVIDHLCRNRSCVNPTHLEPVTVQVNTQRGLLVGKGGKGRPPRKLNETGQPVCSNGHVVVGTNALRRNDRRRPDTVYVTCRQCGIDRNRRARERAD